MSFPINSNYNFGPSRYIVSTNAALGLTNFVTAFNAVVAAGGGTIYVQPGTYTSTATLDPLGTIVNVIGANSVIMPISSYVTPPNTADSEIIFSGNITFAGGVGGQVKFENIYFNASSGNLFTITGAYTGRLLLSLESCSTSAPSGNPFITSSTGTVPLINLNNCSMDASGESFLQNCDFVVNLSNLNSPISFTGGSVQVSYSNIRSSAFFLLSPAVLYSFYNTYSIGGSPNINIESGATLYSYSDTFTNTNTSTGYFLSFQTGVSGGAVNVSNPSITAASGTNIDPALSSITLNPSLSGEAWVAIAANTTVVAGEKYIATALLTLTLPAAPIQGSYMCLIADTAAIVTIQAASGQKLRIGGAISATAGTLKTTSQGDTVKLVYNTSSASWIALDVVGNWTIT